MTSSRVFDVYSDCGHGWIKVNMSVIDKLGIRGNITSYSYIRGEYAYLEEDCDASTFIMAMKNEFGCNVKFRHHNSNKRSKIRSYQHYPYTIEGYSNIYS